MNWMGGWGRSHRCSSAFIGGSFFLALAAPAVRADECASNGPRADRDVPREGDRVPANARFRVLVAPSCGGIENAPEHDFRLIDVDGTVVPSRRETWARWHVELVPEADLAPGTYELQVRRPVSARALGDWQKLVRVTATAERDERAPAFAGIESGTATVGKGHVPISPCQAEDGDVVRTRLEFAAADDAPRDHDELLYRLDRRHPGDGSWEEWRTFRPTPAGDVWFFEWTAWESEAWGVTWEYRIGVRDVAGHETDGEATVTVASPPHPGAVQAPGTDPATTSGSSSDPASPAAANDDAGAADGVATEMPADSEAGSARAREPSAPEPRRGCSVAPQAAGTRGFFGLAVAAAVGVLESFRFRRRRSDRK